MSGPYMRVCRKNRSIYVKIKPDPIIRPLYHGAAAEIHASPIIMMIFTSIYSVVDGFFVSNFAGKTAFASINLVMPFIIILGTLAL